MKIYIFLPNEFRCAYLLSEFYHTATTSGNVGWESVGWESRVLSPESGVWSPESGV
jgi:hypothetical protein